MIKLYFNFFKKCNYIFQDSQGCTEKSVTKTKKLKHTKTNMTLLDRDSLCSEFSYEPGSQLVADLLHQTKRVTCHRQHPVVRVCQVIFPEAHLEAEDSGALFNFMNDVGSLLLWQRLSQKATTSHNHPVITRFL